MFPLPHTIIIIKYTAFEKGVVASLATNAVWTQERLVKAGLAVDNRCPLCLEAIDSVWHRLWVCTSPAVVELRAEVPDHIVQRAKEAGSDHPLFTRGWMEHAGREQERKYVGNKSHQRGTRPRRRARRCEF